MGFQPIPPPHLHTRDDLETPLGLQHVSLDWAREPEYPRSTGRTHGVDVETEQVSACWISQTEHAQVRGHTPSQAQTTEVSRPESPSKCDWRSWLPRVIKKNRCALLTSSNGPDPTRTAIIRIIRKRRTLPTREKSVQSVPPHHCGLWRVHSRFQSTSGVL